MKDKPHDDIEWISNIFKTIFELTPSDVLKRYPTHDAVESNTSPILFFGDSGSDQYYVLESYLAKLLKDDCFHVFILTDNDKLYELEDYAAQPFLILEPGVDQTSLNPFHLPGIPTPLQITIIMDIIRHFKPNISLDLDVVLRLHLLDLFNQKTSFNIYEIIRALDQNPKKSDINKKLNRELVDILQPLRDLNPPQFLSGQNDNLAIERFQSKNIILNLHHLENELAKGFFYNAILWRMWFHAIQNPVTEPNKHVTLMDRMHLACPTIIDNFTNPILEPSNIKCPAWMNTNLMLVCSRTNHLPVGIWTTVQNYIVQQVKQNDLDIIAYKIGMDASKLMDCLSNDVVVFKYANLPAFVVELKYT